jgi:hypothetical protein
MWQFWRENMTPRVESVGGEMWQFWRENMTFPHNLSQFMYGHNTIHIYLRESM